MYGNVNIIATSRLANLIRTKHMLPIHQNANEYGDFLHETYANLLVAHLACALIGFPTDMQKQTRNQNFFLYIHMQTIAAKFWNCLLHLRAHSMLRPRQMFGPLCICMQGWSYVLRFSFTLTHTHPHTWSHAPQCSLACMHTWWYFQVPRLRPQRRYPNTGEPCGQTLKACNAKNWWPANRFVEFCTCQVEDTRTWNCF